jgi:TetR/AcrR family transcriptional regulator, mexJK operon transcriptional repressor
MVAHLTRGGKAKEGDRPPPNRSNRKVQLILAAARKLFIEQGFDVISMDMVAREAAVSKATLYAHFASKEVLFTAAVADEAVRISDAIWPAAPTNENVSEVLRHVAQNFVDIFLTERAVIFQRAILSVVPRLPSIGATIYETGPKALTERLAQYLAQAHDEGRLKIANPTLAATQFLAVVRGDLDIRGLLLPANPPSRAEVEAQIDAGIDLFLHFYSRTR